MRVALVWLKSADRRARRHLEFGRVQVERLGRRLEHTRSAKPEDHQNDRAQDRSAYEELIPETPGGAAALLSLVALPLTLLFVAPVAARSDGHAYPEYRPKLTSI